MASVYLRYNDIWYASYKLADGTWKTPETTKIRNSVYGSRKAKKLALLKANEWEQRELDIRHGRIDLPSIVSYVDLLSDEDKTKLAVILSSNLPSSANGNISTVADQNNPDHYIGYQTAREEWIALVSSKKSKNWLDKERQNNNIFIKFLEASNINLISDIKVTTINAFVQAKEAEGKAPNTITNYLKPVKQLLDYAVSVEYLETNPVGKHIKPGTEVRRKFVYINDDILDKVIDNANFTGDKIYWTFLRYTGLNPVDVSSLTPEAIKDDNGGQYIDTKRTKSNVDVRIPLHPKVEALLKEHGNDVFGVYKETKKLRDLSTERFKRAVYKASKGKIETTLGSLRHTFATNLYNQGYSLDEIKLITGHTTTKILAKTYVTHTEQARAHEAIDKLK